MCIRDRQNRPARSGAGAAKEGPGPRVGSQQVHCWPAVVRSTERASLLPQKRCEVRAAQSNTAAGEGS
eukprot:3034722-Rhodomonas_salina.1